jgi:transposase InsO family protein
MRRSRFGEEQIVGILKEQAGTRSIVEVWRLDYNRARPHNALDWQTPSEFRQAVLVGG